MQIAIYPDRDTISRQAAGYVVQLAQEAVVTRGRFTLALSGGTTPGKLYGLLANEPYRSQIDWTRVHIFWSDERCVPSDDPESNFHLAQQVMLSHLSLRPEQIHRVPADATDRDEASQKYAAEMQLVFGTNDVPGFDLI